VNQGFVSKTIRQKWPRIVGMLIAGTAGGISAVSATHTSVHSANAKQVAVAPAREDAPKPVVVQPATTPGTKSPVLPNSSRAQTAVTPVPNGVGDPTVYTNLVYSSVQALDTDILAVVNTCNADPTSPDCTTAVSQLRSDTQAFLSSLSNTAVPSEYAQANSQLLAGLQALIGACDAYTQLTKDPSGDPRTFLSDVNTAANDLQQAGSMFDSTGA